MEGLSPAASTIIESFSSLEILSEYYLIGGTSLALQINHRLSEDLDFCQWIPKYHVTHAIPAVHILEELKKRFNRVEENRIDFHQANYVVAEPPVRITFYQTALSKPGLYNLIYSLREKYSISGKDFKRLKLTADGGVKTK